jgi:asparagine synthase (glutamine-hydrolysing)
MIPELAALLRSSVAETLEDRVAIAFSGGLDSTLIATLAARDANTELFTCGTERSDDLKAAEELAFTLNLPLKKLIMDEDDILDTYQRCHEIVPAELNKVELLVPVYKCAEAAKANGHEVMLFGSAAEELFVGYARYYSYLSEGKDLDSVLRGEFKELRNREIAWITKVCRKFGLEARFPFYKKNLEEFVRAIPLEVLMEDRELRKCVLREAGKLLGVPQAALLRKKRAMQYGSGIHNIIRKHSKILNGGAVLPQPSSSPSM